jgi:hypothetical protein
MQQEYTECHSKKLEKNVFHSNQETTDDQLNKVGKKIFLRNSRGWRATQKMINYHYKIFKVISILVNTDKAHQEGTHWTVVYADIQHKRIYIYDTFQLSANCCTMWR